MSISLTGTPCTLPSILRYASETGVDIFHDLHVSVNVCKARLLVQYVRGAALLWGPERSYSSVRSMHMAV
jgi:hypothetical protein